MTCQRKFTWLGISAAAVMFVMTGAASAVPLTLNGPINGNNVGPQSSSNPCIIAATQCQQPAGFGFNNFTSSGAISSYNMFSTTPTANVADGVQGTPYTVGQITAIVGNTFSVAIDVNTAGGAGGHLETLQLFEVIIGGAVAYNFVGPALIGNALNNGNGWADFTLSTINLTGLAASTTVLFHAIWNNASDGGESFFLVAGNPSIIPLPGALGLFATGLAGLGLLGWRRKRKVAEAIAA